MNSRFQMGVAPVQVSNNGGYRSPRSPGSSPGGAGGGPMGGGGGNGGPGSNGGGGGESPHYDTYAQTDNYYINQQLLQHHFEQFSMVRNIFDI